LAQVTGIRIASHARSDLQHRYTTIPEHMPSARRYAQWTPARIKREAANPYQAACMRSVSAAGLAPSSGEVVT
jgi:transposase